MYLSDLESHDDDRIYLGLRTLVQLDPHTPLRYNADSALPRPPITLPFRHAIDGGYFAYSQSQCRIRESSLISTKTRVYPVDSGPSRRRQAVGDLHILGTPFNSAS